MKKIKLFFDSYSGHYISDVEIEDEQLNIIHIFLVYDGFDFEFISDWLKQFRHDITSGNLCEYEKKDGDIIIALHDSYKDGRRFPMFQTKKKFFKDMLNQWFVKVSNLNKQDRPKEVTITLHDDGHVIIDTKR